MYIQCIIPGIIFFSSSVIIFNSWNTRRQNYLLISISQVILALGMVGTQIIYGIIYPKDPLGLLIGIFIGQSLSFLSFLIGTSVLRENPVFHKISMRNIKVLVAKYYHFFYYSTPYTIFGNLRVHATVFFLRTFLSQSQLGTYAFVYRVMNFPVRLVSAAIRPVLFQEAAKEGIEKMESKTNNIVEFLLITVPPLVVLFCFYSHFLFQLFFGSKWFDAGVFGLFIIWPIVTFLFCNWLDRFIDILGEQKLALYLESIFSITSLLGLYWSFVYFKNWKVAIGIHSLILVLYNILYLLIVYNKSGFCIKQLWDIFIKKMSFILLYIPLISALKVFFSNMIVIFLYVFFIYSIILIFMRNILNFKGQYDSNS